MFYFNLLTSVLLAATPILASDSPCGDWIQYKDEKCVQVYHDMLSYDEAVKACHLASVDSSLLSIRSGEEQDFMLNSLFKTNNVLETVWLGARFNKVFCLFRIC